MILLLKNKHIVLFLLCVFIVSGTVWSQNPLLKSSRDQTDIYLKEVPEFILEWSRVLQEKIAEFAGLMRSEGGVYYGIAAFFSAILFGIVHVAGPGHGKVFTITYFGSKRSTFREGILLSGLVNIIDSLSAGVLIVVRYEGRARRRGCLQFPSELFPARSVR